MSDAYDRFRWLIIFALTVPLLIGIGWMLRERLNDPDPLVIEANQLPAGEIEVYVTGAVAQPGVYALPDGSRWIDALEAAGGATVEADVTAVNLAKRAQDEDQIVVPKIGTAVAGASTVPVAAVIDINSATVDELEVLPGIGEVRAERIVQSRTTDGPFAQVEDLVLRDLIPTSVFQEIAPMIAVR